MVGIRIKPLSVNEAYRGRRFSTPALKNYKETLRYLLPKIKIPKGKLEVTYVFGLSSKKADGDNLIKAFQDCLSENYGFDDNKIYRWYVSKNDVPKGKEYVAFEINKYVE